MMEQKTKCPSCGGLKGVFSGDGLWTCWRCGDEWDEEQVAWEPESSQETEG